MEFRRDEGGMQEDDFLGFGLTSRKNLCIHPSVSKEKKGKIVDARCRDITNAAVCEKNRQDPGSVEVCDWHEVCSGRSATKLVLATEANSSFSSKLIETGRARTRAVYSEWRLDPR